MKKPNPFNRIVWALFPLALMVTVQSAQAFSISSYDQHAPGRADGVIVIEGVDYSITQIAVQIALPESPIDEIELHHTGQSVQVMIVDSHDRVKSSALTITAISDSETIHRTFQVKGRAPHSPAEQEQPNEALPTQNESTLDLEYAALPTSSTVPDTALEIEITGGQRVRTVRAAIELLLFNTTITLNERPGDDRVLDLPLNPDIPVNRLEDLYAATNGKIGHIYLDNDALIVVPKGITQTIVLASNQTLDAPALTNNLAVDPGENTGLNETPTTAVNSTTLRAIVETLALAQGRVLDEQLGDDRLLNQRIEITDPITEFEQLYALPNKPVKRVIFDTVNHTRTVRVL